jgi:hypothetical protein
MTEANPQRMERGIHEEEAPCARNGCWPSRFFFENAENFFWNAKRRRFQGFRRDGSRSATTPCRRVHAV